MAHTAHTATRVGIPPEKEEALWEYETSPLFSAAERAALRVAQGAAQVPDAVTDDDVAELKRYCAKAAEEFGQACLLTGVEVRPSPLSSTRNIVDVIFSYTNRNTDLTEKFFIRCDMTEEFPFLVTKMSPYYNH